MLDVWTEKYRPWKLEEVAGQKHVVERLKSWVREGSIPHMLFAGPAGTGKTTMAMAAAKEIFGETWRQSLLELNASDTRGIEVVRGQIKDFAKVKSLGTGFKIIFLDESDALTPEAQQALRRTMERYSATTRFILSCNYSSRIIDPIQSRTAVFRFRRLSEEDVLPYLRKIVDGEKLRATEDGLKAVYEVSQGDMRKAVNLLQASSALGEVTREVVHEVSSRASPERVKEMLAAALGGKFPEARKMLYDMLVNQGLSGEDIVKGIHREIFSLEVPEERKLELLERTGEAEFRLNQGGSEEIQLEALLAGFMKAGRA